jgi:hypothetical protein
MPVRDNARRKKSIRRNGWPLATRLERRGKIRLTMANLLSVAACFTLDIHRLRQRTKVPQAIPEPGRRAPPAATNAGAGDDRQIFRFGQRKSRLKRPEV